jgi:hypothetical protein
MSIVLPQVVILNKVASQQAEDSCLTIVVDGYCISPLNQVSDGLKYGYRPKHGWLLGPPSSIPVGLIFLLGIIHLHLEINQGPGHLQPLFFRSSKDGSTDGNTGLYEATSYCWVTG